MWQLVCEFAFCRGEASRSTVRFVLFNEIRFIDLRDFRDKLSGDFVTKVKQINSQSDLIWMRSFAARLKSYNKILCLHHFNLRSLYFQSLQSMPDWIQLHTSRTSAICSQFQ